uniref:C-type lectin domain-containing protein n=1 Tax=Cyprinodon variegatus TaxID=28743 RepID=A0A3Q2DNS1_CYPVA
SFLPFYLLTFFYNLIYNSIFYHYIKEAKTWTEAQQYCRENHTDLATVYNMTDMKRLLSTRPRDKGDAWIGLYDQTDGIRTWYWSLPEVEFNESETNWDQGEPNDHKGVTENCGILISNLKWQNIPCELERPFLCYDGKNLEVCSFMDYQTVYFRQLIQFFFSKKGRI